MGNFKDLTGQRFGRWIVISFAGRDSHGQARWNCRCDCGNEKVVLGYNLRNGHSQSCGCYKSQRSRECHTTHGESHTRLHGIWLGLIQRCTNSKRNRYANYGGKGIKVCDEWLNSFEAFRDWALANGYRDDLSIDRIDPEGDYCPENCRWATDKEQANNTTRNLVYTINGKTQTLQQHIEDPEVNIYDVGGGTVRSRIYDLKWPPEKALSTPVENDPPYTINGKTQTLAQHVADPEINIYGLKKRTVEKRFFILGWPVEKSLLTPPRDDRICIKGKYQTLAQHIKDPEINSHNLKEGTVYARIESGWTPEKAFSTPLRGNRNSTRVI